ncbi:unnamed protein product [Ceratitis capitata]|uniref:(Mediterranean fruit fly) hypothetical protein n=1 Tax=Ceratitis capitata TaxID=7213 RepID=A0A811UDC3_CERCA|nr:unnamed protein product [Ceratitis capitata]
MSDNRILQYNFEELKRPMDFQNSSLSYLMLRHRENLQRSRGDRFSRFLDKAWTKFGLTRRLILSTESKRITFEDATIMKRQYKLNCILKAKIEHMETFKRMSPAQKMDVLEMQRKQILAKQEENHPREEENQQAAIVL